ncbi:PEP-CTERM sorting domain-containing protein [Fischerella thermalis CCMEE 5205]|nr:PEP-CTERM sorting domain-containing protein [Fischerella thermalis CCMEE 5205]
MTRFQVRHKLRKACSIAKSTAVETLKVKQANVKASTTMLKATVVGLGTASTVLALVAVSPSAFAATIVGTELVLSVDVSGSVNSTEFNLQRQGYVDAFRNPTIQEQIAKIPGGIAATLSYWSFSAQQSVPWFLITDATSANAFADAIESTTRPFSGSTGIANAIDFAVNLLNTNDYDGTRRVIDISGDGVENVSSDDGLKTARDNAVQAGIIINGLPILTGDPDLDDYYQENVIGGSGSFLIAANDFSDFGNAVTQKIGREIKPDQPVPEPITILGSLAAGGIGVVLRRKKKQKDTGNTVSL